MDREWRFQARRLWYIVNSIEGIQRDENSSSIFFVQFENLSDKYLYVFLYYEHDKVGWLC